MRFGRVLLGTLVWAALARGQVLPAGRAAATGPARNLERALTGVVPDTSAHHMGLGEFFDSLRTKTQTNIAVNWNALLASGITRDTWLTLYLKNVSYEGVVRTTIEILPTTGGGAGRLNFVVADNVLEITTNAEIGKGTEIRLYDIGKAAASAFPGEKLTDDQVDGNAKLMEKVVRLQLVRSGEPMELAGHSLILKGVTLSASVSERGQRIVDRATGMLAIPVKPGLLPPGTALTAAAKKAMEDFRKATEVAGAKGPEAAAKLVAMDAGSFAGKLNLAILPDTAAELTKDVPQVSAMATDWGVMLIGPREAVASRTVLGAYDLRDVIRRIGNRAALRGPRGAQPAPAADIQAGIVGALQQNVMPDGGWGDEKDLEGKSKKWSVMVALHGELIVFAPADIHRAIGSALQEMNR